MNGNEYRMQLARVQRLSNCGVLIPTGDIFITPSPHRVQETLQKREQKDPKKQRLQGASEQVSSGHTRSTALVNSQCLSLPAQDQRKDKQAKIPVDVQAKAPQVSCHPHHGLTSKRYRELGEGAS